MTISLVLPSIAIPKETQEWLLLLQVTIAHQMMSHQLRFAKNYKLVSSSTTVFVSFFVQLTFM